jgi:hydrogenase-1 operon protein HyaF
MVNINGALIGPGSQPADEDGGTLDYMKMPSGMTTFSVPNLPEPEDGEGPAEAKAALERVLALLQGYDGDRLDYHVELTGLDRTSLDFINQVLGEGEVSIIAGNEAQAQEAVLAGVWRVRMTDQAGRLVRDLIEVASFPQGVLATVFDGAQSSLTIPDSFGPNIFNAPPLLPEINEHVPRSGTGKDAHVINLSLLPHTEEDLAFLSATLGRGATTILSRGYGNCRITATATRNVWWVQFYNSQDTLILNSIEITPIPEVARAAPEDIADSAERLNEILEIYR